MNVYVNGKRWRLHSSRLIGQGGEAEVFDLGQGKALKLFKDANHSDYQGSPQAQYSARERLQEHQSKLRVFPSSLPHRVVQPEALVTDKAGRRVLGYTMPLLQGAEVLLRYADRGFRQNGIPQQTVVEIFRDLHTTVSKLHFKQVIIGDFNDLNVLVRGKEAYLIDADSFQFGSFLCKVFTTNFVDPLLCNAQASHPILVKSHSQDSDWYAFAVMLMQCLLFVGPYGGVYRPQDPTLKIPHLARSLHRISVFHPEVLYPKPGIPYCRLPDTLLHYFHQVFQQDYRGEFPESLLDNLQWTQCLICGTDHARSYCPQCLQTGEIKTVISVRGSVTASRYFTTRGVILNSALQAEKLYWIYYEQGSYKREDGTIILKGDLDPKLHFRLQGETTLIGKDHQVITLADGRDPGRLAVDSYGTLPMFDANRSHQYWIHQGQLLRDGQLGSNYIGDVLANQTQFWMGSHFGFGFYRASSLNIAFVFDAQRRGINDAVKLPIWSGQIVEATCVFSSDRCWFLLATQEQGRTLHHCAVIRVEGGVEGIAHAEKGDGSWLGSLQGKCAVGHFLLVATDEGILRVDPQQNQITVTKTFPDTEPFVDASCRLFVNQEGIHVVNQQEIRLLKLDSS